LSSRRIATIVNATLMIPTPTAARIEPAEELTRLLSQRGRESDGTAVATHLISVSIRSADCGWPRGTAINPLPESGPLFVSILRRATSPP